MLAFRLSGACATFNRIVNKLLERFRHFTSGYFNDVLIFSSSWRNHLLDVFNVLKDIKEAGLNLNRDKCEFGKAVVDFLDFRVALGRVKPKLTIVNFPRPTSKNNFPMMRSRIILSKISSTFCVYCCRTYLHTCLRKANC